MKSPLGFASLALIACALAFVPSIAVASPEADAPCTTVGCHLVDAGYSVTESLVATTTERATYLLTVTGPPEAAVAVFCGASKVACGSGLAATVTVDLGMTYTAYAVGHSEGLALGAASRQFTAPAASLPATDTPDSTPPTSTTDAALAYEGQALITITSVDAAPGWGVSYVYYRLDHHLPRLYRAPGFNTAQRVVCVPASDDGTHTLRYWAQDRAGNVESVKSVTFGVEDPSADTLSAVIDLRTPSLVKQGGEVHLSGHVDDSAGDEITDYSWRSSLDGVLSLAPAFSTSDLSVGTHTLYFRGRCANGVWSTDAVTTVVVTGKDATSIDVTRSAGVVEQSAYMRLSGRLASGESPVTMVPIVLETSSNGTTFTSAAKVTATDSDGSYEFVLQPIASTWYRVRFGGDATSAESVTPSLSVGVRPSVTKPVAPSSTYVNHSTTIYGYLKPVHAAGTYPVSIYRERYVSGHYRAYGSAVRAKASNYSTYTKYSVSLKFPYRGTWRVRAYAPADADHVASNYTSYDYVVVK